MIPPPPGPKATAAHDPNGSFCIRLERAADRSATIRVETDAFGGPVEAGILEQVRDQPGSFALVAEVDGVLVGHVQLSAAWVGDDQVLALGPIGVVAAQRRKGLGSALIAGALTAAADRGFAAVILLGSPRFYGARGFRPASTFGLRNPFTGTQEDGFVVQEEDFQIVVLDADRVDRLRGVVRWHPAFG